MGRTPRVILDQDPNVRLFGFIPSSHELHFPFPAAPALQLRADIDIYCVLKLKL